MPDSHARVRIFEPDRVRRPMGPFLRWIISRYVVWTEVFGYVFCILTAAAIIVCWIVKVDEVAKQLSTVTPKLKPYEVAVKHDKEAVVLRVFVEDWQPVHKGTPVAEACDDADWLQQFKTIQQLETFAKGLRELEKTAPLSADLAAQAAAAEAQVEAWRKTEPPADKRITLKSPHAGEISLTKDVAGKLLKAKESLAKVYDFNDLRLPIKLAGTNTERVRVGQPVKLNVIPDYGKGCILRADTKLGWWRSGRMQFNYVLDAKEMKEFLKKPLTDQVFMTKEDRRRDIALDPKEVKDIEMLMCRVANVRLKDEEAKQVPPDGWLEAERLAKYEDMMGVITDGKHTGTYVTNYLDPEMKQKLQTLLQEKLKSKTANLYPDDKEVIPLRLGDVSKMRNFLRLKMELVDLKKATGDEEPAEDQAEDAAKAKKNAPIPNDQWDAKRAEKDKEWADKTEKAILCDKYKDERWFEGNVRLKDPPRAVSDKLRELIKADSAAALTVKVEAVVDERRLAMLLFRQ
ncbi:MAG: HlyD family secretion protein [Planctomycetes bacterium]|nr:HlyD family secretion protein [Planctomycetota bacterium]MBM4085758.1 HlyD family secretion protein [Planctomycetota bacterium]